MRMEFLGKKGSRRLGVAVVYDLYKTIADTNVCTDSELLEVKVPPYVSARRVSRHAGRDVTGLF